MAKPPDSLQGNPGPAMAVPPDHITGSPAHTPPYPAKALPAAAQTLDGGIATPPTTLDAAADAAGDAVAPAESLLGFVAPRPAAGSIFGDLKAAPASPPARAPVVIPDLIDLDPVDDPAAQPPQQAQQQTLQQPQPSLDAGLQALWGTLPPLQPFDPAPPAQTAPADPLAQVDPLAALDPLAQQPAAATAKPPGIPASPRQGPPPRTGILKAPPGAKPGGQ